MTHGRCFIIDPVCAITYGHSLNSLFYFADLAERYFAEVQIFASRHLPHVQSSRNINRTFEFYYDEYIKIDRRPAADHEIDVKLFKSMYDAAAYDFYGLFSEVGICADDTLMFPSADYYALTGVANALRRIPNEQRPRLLIRLINVMENINLNGPKTLPAPVRKILDLKHKGLRVSICAETQKYSDYLSELSGDQILTAPYPSFPSSLLPLNPDGPFTVLCGGSGREDKGFFRLIDIVEATNAATSNIRFIVQNLHAKDQQSNLEYINRLYAIPNVVLLPGVLPYDEIVKSYAASHLSLMPYDRETYEYRGSAMLMESLLYGRPCIGQAGTAYSEQIKRYRCGEICETNSEMARALTHIARMDRSEIALQAARSRDLYVNEVDQSYRKWIQES